ncbi:hypothetical protein V8C35DRAFT_317446 [Trichoderma chlorosporum]
MATRKPSRPINREDFEVAIVCAKATEYDAVCLLVDEFWDKDGDPFGRAIGDVNVYTTGYMGAFNVVVVLLCNPGKVTAAGSAASLRSSYPCIKLLLLTGVCDGVPNVGDKELLLGDVVISETVVQYDLGSRYPDHYVEKDTLEDRLGRPDKNVRNLIAIMRTEEGLHRLEDRVSFYLREIQDRVSKKRYQPRRKATYRYPGTANDMLFDAAYFHKHYITSQCICISHIGAEDTTCDESREIPCMQTGCNDDFLVPRERLGHKKALEDNGDHTVAQQPSIFTGRFGSGDTVFKSGVDRDRVARKHQILAFETEGAGIWDELPCIIVKGVSTYGDGHKMIESANWENFAAATAASAARGLIDRYPRSDKSPSAIFNDEADRACLKDLYITSPPDDKVRIEQTKGGLLLDVYAWVLENQAYKQWYHDNDNQMRLLWIRGDPGKGKTMLVCGIINELQNAFSNLCYFLCQATDSRLSSASSVLRGLLHMLISKQPSLISYLRAEYSKSGKLMFEDSNSWIVLSRIFLEILKDPIIGNLTLVIDALDECLTDLPELLDLIMRSSSDLQVKWLISSRNETDIQDLLVRNNNNNKLTVSLELNTDSISNAIGLYVEFKVNNLAERRGYATDIKDSIREYLLQNADGTFLWVALVCELLEKAPSFDPLPKSAEYPRGLDNLYERMIEKVLQNESHWGRQILAISTVARRPLSLQEFETLNPFPSNLNDIKLLEKRWEEALGYCGSFLTKRNGIVYFIHQSAKSFILDKASDRLFHGGMELINKHIFSISISAMTTTLKRDMYRLVQPGFLISDLEGRDIPSPDPLAAVGYCCVYWIDHFADSVTRADDEQGHEIIRDFFLKKYIYWLEALSLLRSVYHGEMGLQKLERLLPKSKLVWDAHRFIQMFRKVIEDAPLQVYVSALLFSPTRSIIRQSFQPEFPHWVRVLPGDLTEWTSCVQKLDEFRESRRPRSYHYFSVSCCDTWIATKGVKDIRIWDVKTGRSLRSIKAYPYTYTFSPWNNNELATWDVGKQRMTIWDVSSGYLIKEFDPLSRISDIREMSFFRSEPGILGVVLQDIHYNWLVTVWNTLTGERIRTIPINYREFTFAPPGGKMAYAYLEHGNTVICDFDKANVAHTSKLGWVNGYAFAPLGDCLAISATPFDTANSIVVLLSTKTNEVFRKIELASKSEGVMAFSPNGELLAVSLPGLVETWNIKSGHCVQKTRGKSYHLEFSHDGKWLFSGSEASIDIIEVGRQEMFSPDPNLRDNWPGRVLVSPRGDLVASWERNVLKLWNVDPMTPAYQLRAPKTGPLNWGEGDVGVSVNVGFSPDSTKVFSQSLWSLKVWDISSGTEKRILDVFENDVFFPDTVSNFGKVVFSPDSRFLAAKKTQRSSFSAPYATERRNTHIKVWDTISGKLSMFLRSRPISEIDIKFSPDSKQIAISFSFDNDGIQTTRVEVWDIISSLATNVMVLSNTDLNNHLREKMNAFENEGFANRLLYKSLSFLDDGRLAITYEHYKNKSEQSDLTIQIVLTMRQRPMSSNHITNEVFLTTEESSFDIDPQHSWVTLNGERLIWLPPEYRSQTGHDARFDCVATSNYTRTLSVLKFCCSICPRQEITPIGTHKCTSNAPEKAYTYKRKRHGNSITLCFEMGSPDNEMLESLGILGKEWSRLKIVAKRHLSYGINKLYDR